MIFSEDEFSAVFNNKTEYINQVEEYLFSLARKRKAQGDKIVGVYCAFTPKELIVAADAIPVDLCGSSSKPISAAEQHLPRNLCPLIKSSYGGALIDSCPYFHLSDILVADATCDGKKKMYELLNRIKPVHLLYLPQDSESKSSFDLWLNELYKLKNTLEEKTGNQITREKLLQAIKLYNRLRETKLRVFELNKADRPLLSGSELDMTVDSAGFETDLPGHIMRMEQVIDYAKKRGGIKPRARILLTGCPSGPNKALNVIEEFANVVAMENCGGLKGIIKMADEEGNLMEAIARRSLSVACPCMSPNRARYQLIAEIIDSYNIDGVIDLTWQACHIYNVESSPLGKFIRHELKTPYLQIETDYSESDVNWLKLRIEAFVEML